jgi:hypothetical protein
VYFFQPAKKKHEKMYVDNGKIKMKEEKTALE